MNETNVMSKKNEKTSVKGILQTQKTTMENMKNIMLKIKLLSIVFLVLFQFMNFYFYFQL